MKETSLQIPVTSLIEVVSNLKKPGVQLMDICGVDYPERPLRFDVVYHFLDMTQNLRIRLKVAVESIAPSLTSLFPCANWWEREAWDMYGILFDGHPDLRRILTEDDFEGHPLRKDFPVMGFTEVRYDADLQQVIHEPVQLDQPYREFNFLMLPGDEKA